MSRHPHISTIGLMGFGAFGQLLARHLAGRFTLIVHDPAGVPAAASPAVRFANSAAVAACDVIILAMPVSALTPVIRSLAPHLRRGAIVVDVGSVKVVPARVMAAELPPGVEIVGTHPLFGPQSAANGIAGRKITVCPVRGMAFRRVAAFLRHELGLQVFITTPEAHDREAAVVQGVTHLIARVLVGMEPLPTRLTTASFDHLMQAVEMVRYDAASVFQAIEQLNPFAAEVRDRFFRLAEETRQELEHAH